MKNRDFANNSNTPIAIPAIPLVSSWATGGILRVPAGPELRVELEHEAAAG